MQNSKESARYSHAYDAHPIVLFLRVGRRLPFRTGLPQENQITKKSADTPNAKNLPKAVEDEGLSG